MNFLQALGSHTFLQNALIGALLASLACGVMGPFVVVKRIGYIAGGIAHAALGGMGVAYYYGANPMWGALGAALLSALIIGWVSLKAKVYEDILIGSLWATGMAIGILFIVKTPGYNADLMTYLFGNILIIPESGLGVIALLDVVVLGIVALFFKQLLAVSFDEEFARIRGVPTNFFYLLLLCLIALTTVVLIQIVGLILVIALLTMPAGIAGLFGKSLQKMILLAVAINCVLTTTGLGIAYEANLPAGATIILLVATAFLVALLGKRLLFQNGKTETNKAPLTR